MTIIVTGLYRTPAAVDATLRRLLAAGFPRSEISVVVRDTPNRHEIVVHDTEDTQRGLVTGALAGGLFASLLVGALSLPPIGFLAVGPLTAALAAAGAGAASGGALGALVGHDLSAQTAQEYETALQNGGILLAVHTDRAHHRRAHEVLALTGAELLSEVAHFGRAQDAAGS